MTGPAQSSYFAVIKVVGVGGGGVNAVNRMIEAGLKGVEFIAANTDSQALLMSDADLKLDIGRQLTRGLGAGSDPEVGRAGGRGAPGRDRRGPQGRRHGVHHGRERWRYRDRRRPRGGRDRHGRWGPSPSAWSPGRSPSRAAGARCRPRAGIQNLKEKVDAIIIIPNDRLLTVSTEKTSMVNAFKMADEVLLQGVQGITDLITIPGQINTDFADVRMVLANAGTAIMGIGQATGEGRAVNAARAAITSPLLEASIEGARGILVNIAGGPDLGLFEVNEAMEIIHGVAHPDANIIFGNVIDEAMGDDVRVTVIAAGFERWEEGGASAARAAPGRAARQPGARARHRARGHLRHARRGRPGPRRRRVRRPLLPPLSARRARSGAALPGGAGMAVAYRLGTRRSGPGGRAGRR